MGTANWAVEAMSTANRVEEGVWRRVVTYSYVWISLSSLFTVCRPECSAFLKGKAGQRFKQRGICLKEVGLIFSRRRARTHYSIVSCLVDVCSCPHAMSPPGLEPVEDPAEAPPQPG